MVGFLIGNLIVLIWLLIIGIEFGVKEYWNLYKQINWIERVFYLFLSVYFILTFIAYGIIRFGKYVFSLKVNKR